MKTILATAVVAAAVLAPVAQADGLPVKDVDAGQSGIEAPAEDVRYVAVPARRDTVVHRIRRSGGQVLSSRVLRGRYTIPAVAYDGSAGGISGDGSTLVLIAPRRTFPRATTTFAVLDAKRLTLLDTLKLPGDFSFDALSPKARWLYLIQYTSEVDPVQYEVRALDLWSGKLQREPIVDKRNPDEDMNGHPLTRAASPDGRWAYTLYQGSEHPFVHALDTVNRDARCIDLDWLHGRKDLSQMRFAVDAGAGELLVRSRGQDVARVDTLTFAASVPRADSAIWPWLALPAAGLLVAGFFGYRAVSRRASSTSFGGATST